MGWMRMRSITTIFIIINLHHQSLILSTLTTITSPILWAQP
uniref:E3 ubiquitin-protein ligase n=1 Tax=Rhizophora mucronata TaxID=61149 RepID=A0A2P2KBS7_RHIMU